jgi:hypothetical protein
MGMMAFYDHRNSFLDSIRVRLNPSNGTGNRNLDELWEPSLVGEEGACMWLARYASLCCPAVDGGHIVFPELL